MPDRSAKEQADWLEGYDPGAEEYIKRREEKRERLRKKGKLKEADEMYLETKKMKRDLSWAEFAKNLKEKTFLAGVAEAGKRVKRALE